MSGLVSRLLGRGRGRPVAADVTTAVTAAIEAVPGAVVHRLDYNHLQYSSGALSGLVGVAGPATFERVLRTAHDTLRQCLGGDADRVVVYLTGQAPDAAAITPEQLGLPPRPTGADLADHYA